MIYTKSQHPLLETLSVVVHNRLLDPRNDPKIDRARIKALLALNEELMVSYNGCTASNEKCTKARTKAILSLKEYFIAISKQA